MMVASYRPGMECGFLGTQEAMKDCDIFIYNLVIPFLKSLWSPQKLNCPWRWEEFQTPEQTQTTENQKAWVQIPFHEDVQTENQVKASSKSEAQRGFPVGLSDPETELASIAPPTKWVRILSSGQGCPLPTASPGGRP